MGQLVNPDGTQNWGNPNDPIVAGNPPILDPTKAGGPKIAQGGPSPLTGTNRPDPIVAGPAPQNDPTKAGSFQMLAQNDMSRFLKGFNDPRVQALRQSLNT